MRESLDWARRGHPDSHAPVAQLDSASVFGTEGCRFESCRAYFIAGPNFVIALRSVAVPGSLAGLVDGILATVLRLRPADLSSLAGSSRTCLITDVEPASGDAILVIGTYLD